MNPFRGMLNLLQKFSAASPLIFRMYAAQPWGVFTKRNYAQYSDDAYKRNAVAYACIKRVAEACASLPLKLRNQGGKVIDDHPVLQLLKKPNPFQSGHELFEAVVAYFLLSGNTYIEGIGPDNAPPLELWSLRTDRVRVVPGQFGPAGYVYEVNGARKDWPCDPIQGKSPILHVKTFNPLDDWYGMSPVEAAAYAVDQHNMAGEWNQSLLQNSGRPSGALVYSNNAGGTLSDKQYARLKEEINAALVGTRNAGRVPIFDGGLSWQQMSMTPAEMDWINGKAVSAREICLVFNVPPMLMGIPGDNTFSNYKEARQAFYEDTVLPVFDGILDGLNRWLLPAFAGLEGYELFVDVEKLPALEPKRAERWQAVATADWLTINEKREATGYERITQPEADEVFLPSGLMPLTGSTEPPEAAETPGPEGDGAPEGEDPPAGEQQGGQDNAGEGGGSGEGTGGAKPGKGKPVPPNTKKYVWERIAES